MRYSHQYHPTVKDFTQKNGILRSEGIGLLDEMIKGSFVGKEDSYYLGVNHRNEAWARGKTLERGGYGNKTVDVQTGNWINAKGPRRPHVPTGMFSNISGYHDRPADSNYPRG